MSAVAAVETESLLGLPPAETAFLAGAKAVAADVAVIVAATMLVMVVAMRDPAFQAGSPETWDYTVWVELSFCLVGLLGILNVVVSGSGYVGLYVGGGAKNAAIVNGHFYLLLGAILVGDYALRLALGGDAPRAFSNWAVMVASGASANLMAPWPFSHRALGSIDKGLWVLLWVLYQITECWVSLFGALDQGWLLIVLTLVLRRCIFIVVMGWLCKVTFGSIERNKKFLDNNALLPLWCPSLSVGAYKFEPAPEGKVKLDYNLFNLDAGEPMPNTEELAAMGGGFLLKAHMLGGMAPWPIDPNPIVFLEQMISFGSPTAVMGSRAAIGHILYVAFFVKQMVAATASWEKYQAVEDDMLKPPAERLPANQRVNRFKSQGAARLLMREWLHGSRARALAMCDSAEISPELLKSEATMSK